MTKVSTMGSDNIFLNPKHNKNKAILNGADNIDYVVDTQSFFNSVTNYDYMRFLKGKFTNLERLKSRLFNSMKAQCMMNGCSHIILQFNMYEKLYEEIEPFSIKEAFEIQNDVLRALVWGTIDVVAMISHFGTECIEVKGMPVTHVFYNLDKTSYDKTYDVVYELHKVDTRSVCNDYSYAVKCWCTSTNKEHWLWVEDSYAEQGVLTAIASTMIVYESMIPHISCLKRHGDVLIFEMKSEHIPSDKLVPLTAEQYFGFLKSQG